ncbi:hypothetical protein HanRHA438_Chr13g0602811 [Helianthus annuus]|nr:hypothetical protein HanHA300_Chr13g0485681 [Helianthus annuus]KAJ0498033.1 hypothetical protein HanHA89_Chr13g0517821 [Helianthus annuus]KAJ0664032.1 hypothetical protein HanLR1_Chr13g0487651 [Helianthus annuus]KAJ0858597.1 hypothetical protein HanRHA438_Chr13g0602811 [Helianthus annuus]
MLDAYHEETRPMVTHLVLVAPFMKLGEKNKIGGNCLWVLVGFGKDWWVYMGFWRLKEMKEI